jgi:hypothetical protein
VHRLADREHHVVGDVDDVVDRPLSRRDQPLAQPERRRANLDVLEDARGEAQADVGVGDLDARVVLRAVAAGRLGVGGCRVLAQRSAGRRVDLTCDPVDRQAVGSVRRDLELERLVGDRQDIGERRAGGERVAEDHDPLVLVAQAQLVLGADHPVRLDAAQLGLAELRAVGHRRAGQRDRHRLAGGDVRCAADDRARLTGADVDRADLQPVGVRVLLGAQHLADDEAVGGRHADPLDPLELGPGQVEPLGELDRRQARVAVLAQPRVRNPHDPNCSRKRTSLSKNSRRSGTPWRSIAIRSMPIPNAKP